MKKALAGFLLLTLPAWGASTDKAAGDLHAVTKAITSTTQKQEALLQQKKRLQQTYNRQQVKLVQQAKELRIQEKKLATLRQKVAQLQTEKKALQNNLFKNEKRLARLLSIFQRIALYPPEAALLSSQTDQNALEAGLLFRYIIPYLDKRSQSLNEKLASYDLILKKLAQQTERIKSVQRKMVQQRAEIRQAHDKQQQILRAITSKVSTTQATLKKLSAKAESLKDLIENLERRNLSSSGIFLSEKELTARYNRYDFKKAKGALVHPVSGRVDYSFGRLLKSGFHEKGIYIAATRGGQIVAPWEGLVVYVDKLQEYGTIVIIKHNHYYYSMMAGFDSISAQRGQWILKGEPIGTALGDNQKVYFELRYKNNPLNPRGWFSKI